MIELQRYVLKLVDFSEEEVLAFTKPFRLKKMTKGQYLAREGEIAAKLAFVKAGVLRAFFRNEEGKEYNKTFFTEGNFVGAYSSLITGKENLINIQCLTDVELWIGDYHEITKDYSKYANFERFGRRMAEYKFVLKEKREIELVTLDASERYQIFRKEHPGLENRIPQYHIASYLGVSATQLSRIRAQR